jgi:putative tryptophan/tyrosine transport system substrate-binding protein
MKRRDFITLLGSATLWPLVAGAEERQKPMVGFLNSGSRNGFEGLVGKFRQGLHEQGYDELANLALEYRWADRKNERLPALANELVQMRVKVIAASGGVPSARAAMNAAMKVTPPIPVVFLVGPDPGPLGIKLVPSLSRPGGNATGASLFSSLMTTKRMETMFDALQLRDANVGILASAESATVELEIEETQGAATYLREKHGFKIDIVRLMASDDGGIERAFETAKQQKVSALLVSADPFFTDRKEKIVELARIYKIPAMYPWREYVKAGGLMSYGADLGWGYEFVGKYTGRILKGEKAAELPVEQASRFIFTVNSTTAKGLGLEFSSRALPDEELQ